MDRVELPAQAYPDDDGSADPRVRAALLAAADGTGESGEALAALHGARLLVPVVAVLGEVEIDGQGLAHDKSSDMAAVLLTGADGRRALLAFTGTDSLAAWDPAARPVPVPLHLAAQAALQEQASAVVVDVAGPAAYVVAEADLGPLASRWRLVRVESGLAWLGPAEDDDPTQHLDGSRDSVGPP